MRNMYKIYSKHQGCFLRERTTMVSPSGFVLIMVVVLLPSMPTMAESASLGKKNDRSIVSEWS